MHTGEKNLAQLLASLKPLVREEIYVFISLEVVSTSLRDKLSPMMVFDESEGTTLIVEKAKAVENSIPFNGEFACITLSVHSSLEAVGLTAAASTVLANANISANVVAAFYHDHIFVPHKRRAEAIACLRSLSNSNMTGRLS